MTPHSETPTNAMNASEGNARYCKYCDQVKPLAEFKTSKKVASGYERICLACYRYRHATRMRLNYQTRPEVRARRNEYARLRRARIGKRDWQDPIKENARAKLHQARKKGEIVRPDNCQACGAVCVPHGHHHDYSRPLDVEWLCSTCHNIRHRKHGDAA